MAGMTLHYWRSSEWLKRYGSGHIIVMADNVEDARQKVRNSFMSWVVDNHSWLDWDDKDDWEEIEKMRALMEADISAIPTHEAIYC